MVIPEAIQRHFKTYLIAGIALFYFIVNSSTLWNDPFLTRDDLRLVQPLQSISNVSSYIDAVKSDVIADVQPLRDLSFLVNIKIFELTGFKTFHLTNFLLVLVCLFVVIKILEILKFNRLQITTTVLLIAFHPIMVSALGWISSRKHILGLILILYSTFSILKKEKLTAGSILSYAGALCSHQIFVFFPIWVLVLFKIKNYKLDVKLFSLMIVGGLAVFTLGYYKTYHVGTGDDAYNLYSLSDHISRSVLSIGRATALIFFPFSISAVYSQGSIFNMLGLGFFVIYIYLVYKNKNWKDASLWIILAVISFGPSLIAFVNDTYLYLPLITIIISLIYLLNDKLNKIIPVVVVAVLLLAAKTVTASKMWRSDKDLWQYSYEQENDPYSAFQLGYVLLKHNKQLGLEFMTAGARELNLNTNHGMLSSYLFTIYESDLPFEKKLKLFRERSYDNEIYRGAYGLLLLDGDKSQQATGLTLLKPDFSSGKEFVPGAPGDKILKGIRKTCLSSFDKTYICRELNITY